MSDSYPLIHRTFNQRLPLRGPRREETVGGSDRGDPHFKTPVITNRHQSGPELPRRSLFDDSGHRRPWFCPPWKSPFALHTWHRVPEREVGSHLPVSESLNLLRNLYRASLRQNVSAHLPHGGTTSEVGRTPSSSGRQGSWASWPRRLVPPVKYPRRSVLTSSSTRKTV